MAWQDPSSDIYANLTDYARTLIARAILGDVVFQVVGFGLGRYGFDTVSFSQALPLNTADTELTDKVYPDATAFSYDTIISTEEPTATARVFNCRVGSSIFPGNADFALGELALYGVILKSDVPSEIGTVFMYAMSHFPVLAKTRRDTLLRRVIVSN